MLSSPLPFALIKINAATFSSSSSPSSVSLFSSNVIGGRVGRVVGTLLYGGSDFLEEDEGKHPNKQVDSEQEKWSTFLSCRFLTLIKAKRAPHPPCRQTCATSFEQLFFLTTKTFFFFPRQFPFASLSQHG